MSRVAESNLIQLHSLARLNRCGRNSTRVAIRRGWCYPRAVKTFGERLLGQQLWCWGRDIIRPQSNLLIDFGFRRHRAKDSNRDGSSCYRIDEDARHLAIWGFGVFYGRRGLGGLYLNRFSFRPQWANIEAISLGIHLPPDLPPFEQPKSVAQWRRAHRLWNDLLRWLSDYERWVIDVAGVEYRQRCVDDWLYPFVAAEHVPQAWRLLRQRCWETDPARWQATTSRIRLKGKA